MPNTLSRVPVHLPDVGVHASRSDVLARAVRADDRRRGATGAARGGLAALGRFVGVERAAEHGRLAGLVAAGLVHAVRAAEQRLGLAVRAGRLHVAVVTGEPLLDSG